MKIGYGKSCINRGHYYKRIEQFKNGRTSVSGENRSGRRVAVATRAFETRMDLLKTIDSWTYILFHLKNFK